MKRLALAVSTIALVLLTSSAGASETGIALVTGSPTGIGLELTQGVTSRFNVRLGAGLSTEATAKDVTLGHNKYEVEFKFGGVNAFVDWHPWRGNFRLSGGLVTLRNDLAFERTKAPIVLGEASYPASALESLNGVAHLDRTVAPAFLVGWGNSVKRGRRVGLQFEVGLAWAGDTTTTLTAEGPQALDPVVRQNLGIEARSVDDDARGALTGIVRLGITYHF